MIEYTLNCLFVSFLSVLQYANSLCRHFDVKGFTRSYLSGETDSADVLLENVKQAVLNIGAGKRFVLVDGVG